MEDNEVESTKTPSKKIQHPEEVKAIKSPFYTQSKRFRSSSSCVDMSFSLIEKNVLKSIFCTYFNQGVIEIYKKQEFCSQTMNKK